MGATLYSEAGGRPAKLNQALAPPILGESGVLREGKRMSLHYARDLSEFNAPLARPHSLLRFTTTLALVGAVLISVDVVSPVDAMVAPAVRSAVTFVRTTTASIGKPVASAEQSVSLLSANSG